MQYRHISTGAVIDVRSAITGSAWEPVAAPAPVSAPVPEKKTPKKRVVKK